MHQVTTQIDPVCCLPNYHG